MKKMLLMLVVTVFGATATFAQNKLVATLSHNGQVTVFYGANALIDAHNAADHGDVITLSSGNFNTTTITKAITLRGVRGWGTDNIAPTYISGNVYIQINSDVELPLTIEGIQFRHPVQWSKGIKNSVFRKCLFLGSDNGNSNENTSKNISFIHCCGNIYLKGSDITCISSAIKIFSDGKGINFVNCNVGLGYNQNFYNCSLLNSVIYCKNTGNSSYNYIYLNSSNNVENCVSDKSSTFNYLPAANNRVVTISDSDKNNYCLYTHFEETGDDGTEVGIYGGAMPFDASPTYPQITKCNVSSKSTVDGKISVDIEVSAIE